MSTNNRYVIASCGVILHLMLGSTYAWSVYRNPIIAETSWNQSAIAFAFRLPFSVWACRLHLWGKLWKNLDLVLLVPFLLSYMLLETS